MVYLRILYKNYYKVIIYDLTTAVIKLNMNYYEEVINSVISYLFY